jgi:hypothetical protein
MASVLLLSSSLSTSCPFYTACPLNPAFEKTVSNGLSGINKLHPITRNVTASSKSNLKLP